jgi:hypothetical protein
MNKIRSVTLAVLTAMLTGLWFPGTVVADHLAAPTGLLCPVVGGVIEADWDELANATKYSVNVIATYDPLETPLDPTDDVSLDFDFGTSDRIDGAPISQSDLDIALSALEVDFGSGALAPYDVQVRVKGLHSGKKQGRQNNPFSGLCDAV